MARRTSAARIGAGRHRRERERQGLAMVGERGRDIAAERVEADAFERHGAVVDASEVEELADDRVHLLDAARQAGAELGLGLGGEDLHAEAQLGQRRAQVVRNAGEHEGALALGRVEAAHQLVEAAAHRLDLERAVFGERLGPRAAAQHLGGVDERAQGLADAALDRQRAEQRRARPPPPKRRTRRR